MNIIDFVRNAPVGKQMFSTTSGYDVMLYKTLTSANVFNFEAVVIRSADSTLKMNVEVRDSGLNFWTIILGSEVNCFCAWNYFVEPVKKDCL